MERLLSHVLFCIALTFSFSISYGQNLVPNPSFEDTVDCFWNYGLPEAAQFWYNPTLNTPDYITDENCGPNTYNQAPRTGNAYMGVFCYGPDGNGEREYVSVKLNDTLIAGNIYSVKFFVSPDELSKNRVNNIGLKFSDSQVYENTINELSGNADVYHSTIITDSSVWTEISGSYTAIGGECFITIGNFFSDSETIIDSVASSFYNGGYYYVDDVEVIEDSTNSIWELNSSFFKIYPNPVVDNIIYLDFTNSLEPSPTVISFVDQNGKLVYETTIIYSVNGLPIHLPIELSGQLLFVRITTNSGKIFYSKLFIN